MSSEDPQAMQLLFARQESLEGKVRRLEAMIPKLVLSTMSMFFKAAADARTQDPFEFALFEEGDSFADSLKLAKFEEGLVIYAAVEGDQWVQAEWIHPNSQLWNKALAFLDELNLPQAHVKIVTHMPAPEGAPHAKAQ